MVQPHTNFSTTRITYTRVDNYEQDIEEKCFMTPYYKISLGSLFIITIALSIFENILLWVVFASLKRLRTIANTYVISLSIGDFVVTVTVALFETYYIWRYPKWDLGEVGSNIQNAFWCFSLVCPFMHIMLISVDRYKAVNSPILYTSIKSWIVELRKIIALWVYCICVVLLMAFNFSHASEVKYEWNVLPVWYYPFLAVHTIIPLFVCSFLYWRMVGVVRLKKHDLRRYNSAKTEFKFARTIGLIIFLLYLVWAPVIVMETIYGFLASTCIIGRIGVVSVWFSCSSGVINPFVFLWKNKEFRKVIKRKRSRRSRYADVHIKQEHSETNV